MFTIGQLKLAVILCFCIFVLYMYLNLKKYGNNVSESAESKSIIYNSSTGHCLKGPQLFTRELFRKEFLKFIEVYETRPKASNYGGTRLAHQFAIWTSIRRLKPKYIIESGVNNGLGTWIIRQAAPTAKLILIDPKIYQENYVDKHSDTVYLRKEDFIDFGRVDWSKYEVNPSEAFVFFDDHQSGIKRTAQAWKEGFRYIMFDDNIYNGDNFSLRDACLLQNGFINASNVKFKDNFGRDVNPLTKIDIASISLITHKAIKSYIEFPLPFDLRHEGTDVLFPEVKSETKLKEQFGIKDISSDHQKVKGHFKNICLVVLHN